MIWRMYLHYIFEKTKDRKFCIVNTIDNYKITAASTSYKTILYYVFV